MLFLLSLNCLFKRCKVLSRGPSLPTFMTWSCHGAATSSGPLVWLQFPLAPSHLTVTNDPIQYEPYPAAHEIEGKGSTANGSNSHEILMEASRIPRRHNLHLSTVCSVSSATYGTNRSGIFTEIQYSTSTCAQTQPVSRLGWHVCFAHRTTA